MPPVTAGLKKVRSPPTGTQRESQQGVSTREVILARRGSMMLISGVSGGSKQARGRAREEARRRLVWGNLAFGAFGDTSRGGGVHKLPVSKRPNPFCILQLLFCQNPSFTKPLLHQLAGSSQSVRQCKLKISTFSSPPSPPPSLYFLSLSLDSNLLPPHSPRLFVYMPDLVWRRTRGPRRIEKIVINPFIVIVRVFSLELGGRKLTDTPGSIQYPSEQWSPPSIGPNSLYGVGLEESCAMHVRSNACNGEQATGIPEKGKHEAH